jgi:hypothetical protein
MLEVRVIYIYTVATSNSLKYHPRALRTKHNPKRTQRSFTKYVVGPILY